tara:strand:+ start:569 stop:820 length:252 start_codon:yes stop_codon:yes gene_type:complete
MPNEFNLVEFVNTQLTQNERQEIQGVVDDNSIDYAVYATALEKIVLDSLLKYPTTVQSSELKKSIAVLLQPLAEKLNQGNLDI